MTIYVRADVIATALVCLWTAALTQDISTSVSFCTVRPRTTTSACERAVTTLLNSSSIRASCTWRQDSGECVQLIESGRAHLHVIQGDEHYFSLRRSIVPALQETTLSQDDTEIYSIAVTTDRQCDATTTVQSFKGRRACSSGFRNMYGWELPLGYLANRKLAVREERLEDIKLDAQSMMTFFGNMCAPGIVDDGPRTGGLLWRERLCPACKGNCGNNDPYIGGQGALRCLSEGSGDIAMLDHLSLLSYMQTSGDRNISRMRLVCGTGGCSDLTDYASCHLAKLPPRTVVTSSAFQQSPLGQAILQQLANVSSAEGKQALVDLGVIGRTRNSLQVSNGSMVSVVSEDLTMIYGALEEVVRLKVIFCTVGDQEQQFCNKVAPLVNSKTLGLELSCLQRKSVTECSRAIEHGEATLRSFEFGDMYEAHRTHSLKLIAAEVTEDQSPDLFATAVVRREFCEQKGGQVTFEDLRGKGMCSTGYFRPNGWHMPVAHLLTSGMMPVVDDEKEVTNDAESVMAFFGTACAAGVRDNGPIMTEDGSGRTWKNKKGLCSACKEAQCDNNDPYFGVRGVYKCLADGAGSVAFAGSESLRTFLTRNNTGRDPEEFRLLCPGGGCAPVTQFAQCNIGRAKLQGVMIRSSYPSTKELQRALVRMAEDPDFKAIVFNATSNPNEHMFRGMSRGLRQIEGDTLAYLGHLVPGLQALSRMRRRDVPLGTSSSRRSDVLLSAGALAGAVLGAIAGGVALAAIGLLLWQMGYIRHSKGLLQPPQQQPKNLEFVSTV